MLVPERDGSYTSYQRTFVARIHPDGSVSVVDLPNLRLELFGASFDVTDAIMRSQGMDPYASEKLRFLDRTRDMRLAMAAEHRAQQLSHSGELMMANIHDVWATVPDLASRKQALFELWDECAESGDPALVAAGDAARGALVAFIQRELTGPEAYTRDELDRLNARRTSAAVFDPYARPERVAVRR